jgi:hypothetical protein
MVVQRRSPLIGTILALGGGRCSGLYILHLLIVVRVIKG